MLDYRMQQRQLQKLVLTPKLRQSINILQMPTTELCAFINQQLVENPILESDSSDIDERDPAAEQEVEDRHDIDWHEYFADCSDLGYVRDSRGINIDEERILEPPVRWTPTLYDQLISQLCTTVSDPTIARIGQCIIASLDRDGYLRSTVEEIAHACSTDTKLVRKALEIVQGLEPAGVASRDLKECLAIQLKRRDMDADLRRLCIRIVTRHLKDLASMTTNQLAKVLRVDLGSCQLAVDAIRSLNPRPALTFDPVADVAYVIPDVIVKEVDGDFVVVMNDSAMPRLRFNAAYARLARNGGGDVHTTKYLKEHLESAIWLVKSIEQRRNTIYRITERIVCRQRDFFVSGTKALKPMTLRDVADDLGIHESTVSRASAGKYVQTPRGTYELSFFFHSGVQSVAGEGVSSEAIKRLISEIIEAEDPRNPLSDLAITKKLQSQGIMVSRRTVAKYRESVGIPSSMGRRRYVHRP